MGGGGDHWQGNLSRLSSTRRSYCRSASSYRLHSNNTLVLLIKARECSIISKALLANAPSVATRGHPFIDEVLRKHMDVFILNMFIILYDSLKKGSQICSYQHSFCGLTHPLAIKKMQ